LLPLKVRSDDVVILYGSELYSLHLHLMILICSDTIFLSFNTHADPVYSDGDDQNEDEEIETISAKRSSKKGSKRSTRKKGSDKSNADSEPSSVIYLGHLPVGFEEREISVFLNQFGNVLRCRVSRSKKTGRSRGYAFVEFVDHEVANIVAETMSGYFLLEKRLVCHIVPNDQVHDLMFAKAKRIATKADLHKKARLEVNKQRSADALKGITAKLVKREDMKRKKLAALGIDYDFPGYAAGAQSTDDDVEPNSKRRRTMSSEDNDEEQADLETKTPKSSKKKKKTTKASKVGNEKENDTNAPKKSKEKEEKTDKFSPRVTRSKKSKKTPKK
jgi:nucleolar protein 15